MLFACYNKVVPGAVFELCFVFLFLFFFFCGGWLVVFCFGLLACGGIIYIFEVNLEDILWGGEPHSFVNLKVMAASSTPRGR